MKYYEDSIIFQYSWNQIAQAIWKKYPNPESTHVLSEDTIFRKVIGNKLHTKRLLIKTNRLPKWGERLVNVRNVNIIEESVVDPVNKEICTYTRNVGLTKLMTCVEKVVYRPSPTHNGWTVAERKAWIDSHIFGFNYAIQKFGFERYKKNVTRANNGFMFVMKHLYPSVHVTDVPAISGSKKLDDSRHRLKDAAKETAKRAKEIAQEKTRPIFGASYES